VPHIELSLSTRDGETAQSTCREWATPVRGSADACLLIDANGLIFATSPSCRALLGLTDGVDTHGRSLLDGTVQLVNFAASGGALPLWEAERIPPLQALHTGALARGLLRVSAGGIARTLDAVSTPLHGGAAVAGSLTFFRRC
jgi:PAS domain-containing protein